MTLPIGPPIHPMLAKLQADIPSGDGWLYEPKWDGFRAIAFVSDTVTIGSRNTQPLERYFPDVCAALEASFPECVVDGEIIIATPEGLDFEALQQRIHPAASRVKMLAGKTPASFVAFDLLASGGEDVRPKPFAQRRAMLEEIVRPRPDCFLTPQTSDRDEASDWFQRFEGAGLDGVIARRAELPYVEKERVLVKVKHERTIDCVVGGYRLSKKGDGIGSFLLGLYAGDGTLHYVGFTSTFKAPQRVELLEMIRPLEGGDSFGAGRSPGGPSRWNRGQEESTAWNPLQPELVCEVAFDRLQKETWPEENWVGYRFRHGSRFVRFRPDKGPAECTLDQLALPAPFSLDEIRALSQSR